MSYLTDASLMAKIIDLTTHLGVCNPRGDVIEARKRLLRDIRDGKIAFDSNGLLWDNDPHVKFDNCKHEFVLKKYFN